MLRIALIDPEIYATLFAEFLTTFIIPQRFILKIIHLKNNNVRLTFQDTTPAIETRWCSDWEEFSSKEVWHCTQCPVSGDPIKEKMSFT